MAVFKGKKPNKSGMYWVSFKLRKSDKFKLVIAEALPVETEGVQTYRLLSNSSLVKSEPEWKPVKANDAAYTDHWYFLDVLPDEVHEVFDWNF